MDAEQIRTGDFSSAAGTWTAADGTQLTIAGNRIDWSLGGQPFATVAGHNLTLATGETISTNGDATVRTEQDPDSMVLWWGTSEGGFITSDTDLTEYVATRADGGAPAETTPAQTSLDEPCTPPAPGAYECAGGPLPAEAREVSTVLRTLNSQIGILQTPSGNIACSIANYAGKTPTMECSVSSWYDDPPVPPVNTGEGNPFLQFGDGSSPPVFGGSKHDPFCHMPHACPADNGPLEPEVVEYGEIVHFAGFACSSAQNGLTCWNVRTGNGAFFSRANFEIFTGQP